MPSALEPRIWIEDKQIVVVPPELNAEAIREVLGGRQSKKQKPSNEWRLAPTALNVLTLADWYGVELINTAPQAVQDLLYLDWGFPGFGAHPDLKAKAESHPHWLKLYPFQRIAVEYMVCNPHRGGLIGLSPGLGKTPVTIISMDILELTKILILAPLTLAKNWGKELEKWSRFYRSWTRATASDKDPKAEVTITNFETAYYTILRREDGKIFLPEEQLTVLLEGVEVPYILLPDGETKLPLGIAKNPRAAKLWIDKGPKTQNPKNNKMVPARERITQARPSYSEVDWDAIVIDESILMKNRKAVKVEVVQQLTKYAHWVWLLSGSATAKLRDDLFPQVQTLMPRGFSAYWRFAEFFCIIERGQWGWDVTSDRPDHDPQKYLKDFYLVMNQKDVLPDLPDYIYDPIEIDLNADQRKAFRQMMDDWIVALEAEEGQVVIEGDEDLAALGRLAQLTRALQITSNLINLEKGAGKAMPNSSAKEDLLVDLIRMGDIEFPLLVWTWYVPTTRSVDARLEREFKDLKTVHVVGEMSSADKDLGIDLYKRGEVDVLVLQMGVGKFGHTLTDTRTVYYHDRTVDSDAYFQSLRRVKRIGLTHRPRLIVPRAKLSADPLIEANLAGKMQSVAKVASHDLLEFLRSLGNLEWALEDEPGGDL